MPKTFAGRLAMLMEERNYLAPRGSRLKYDAKKLAQIGEVRSIESARKWLEGKSEPRGKPFEKIVDHFEVNRAWLRDGEGNKYQWETQAREARAPSTAKYSPISPRGLEQQWRHLSPEVQHKLIDLLEAISRMVSKSRAA